MKAIAVDDEIYMLEALQEAVSASADIDQVKPFSSCSEAPAYAAENPIDIAFLDINMRGIGGLGLAEKLIELQPGCRIVFCAGYEEYAAAAFQLHASGYLMKPITPEAVQREIDRIKGAGAADVLRHDTPYYRVDTGLLRCDYCSFPENGKPEFRGEYMAQYSWAEATCGILQYKKINVERPK